MIKDSKYYANVYLDLYLSSISVVVTQQHSLHNPMARATTHSTVVTGMDKDWQFATDSFGSTLLEDGILECQDLMVDDNYDSTSIWADSSRTLSWHNEVTGLSQSLEQDEFAFPLPSRFYTGRVELTSSTVQIYHTVQHF
jgi:hypothetical protein